MFGIKIAKIPPAQGPSKWPGQYHSLHVLLIPIAEALRPLWWVTEHLQYAFPPGWMSEQAQQPGVLSGPSFQNFDASFLPDIKPPVARPGFLPTFANTISGDWSVLHGLIDDPSHNTKLLEALGRVGWFDPPSNFPPEISISIRGIDWAYWEVFARNQKLVIALHEHLKDVPGLKVELLYPE
jgi:hypothetical protein